MQFAVVNLPAFTSAAVRIGLADELRDALTGHVESAWTEVAHAYGSRDFAKAADTLETIGTKPDAAEARLWAAREHARTGRPKEANEQLELALAFYRSVDATSFVRECEAVRAD